MSLAASLTLGLAVPTWGQGQGPQADPRVQKRTYVLNETGTELPYWLFVSSKVSKDKKNPLIVALHGLGGDGNSLLRGNALDLAEEGGYILVGPEGFNNYGWFGFPDGPGVLGRGKQLGAQPGDPKNLRELSERDVMSVLELMKQEFSIDPQRTYLMGHSMGGAGTWHIGVKYQKEWAAIAAIAPAAFAQTPEMLAPIKDTMPVYVIQGDKDTAVPVENTRITVESLKTLKMNFKYVEVPGGDHGSVITTGMPQIFEFFKEHARTGPLVQQGDNS